MGHMPQKGKAEPPSPRAWSGQRRREPGLISRPGRTGRAPGGCPEPRRHVRERPGGGGARRRLERRRAGAREIPQRAQLPPLTPPCHQARQLEAFKVCP